MVSIVTYYELILATSSIISIAIALFSWQRRPAKGALSLSILMLAVAFWSICNLLETASPEIDDKIFWAKMAFFGIVLVPVSWLALSLQYTARDSWLSPFNLALLSIEPIVVILLVWTNESYGLIWSGIELTERGPFNYLDIIHGPGFWIHTAYSYALLLAGTLLLFQFLVSSPPIYRGQAMALVMGALIPWIVNALSIAGHSPIFQMDITSLSFTLTGLIAAWALFRFKLLDIAPIAHDAIFAGMGDGVIVMDSQNRIVDFNPAAERIIGPFSREIAGLHTAQIESSKICLLGRFLDAREADEEIDMEQAEGKRYYDMKISPLYDHVGGYAGKIVVLRDITDRKAVEKELLKAREDLEQKVEERTFQLEMANDSLKKENEDRMRAQLDREILIKELESKNCEMERFIYTVSHDLRSPLVTIHGFVGFLEKDLEAGPQENKEKVEDDLKRIGDAAVRMDRLLCDTLELSRIGRVAEPPEDIAFWDIVSEALDQLSERLRSRGVEVSVADGLPKVYVDRLRIVEALTNIIENSIKYMGEQPSPRIEIGQKAEKERSVKEAVFYVRDNGIGIEPSQHIKVFDLFYKIDKKSEGTGAGLAIVKRIIEVHGGHVWIESQKGQGCTVWFTLPLSKRSAHSSTSENEMDKAPINRSPTMQSPCQYPRHYIGSREI